MHYLCEAYTHLAKASTLLSCFCSPRFSGFNEAQLRKNAYLRSFSHLELAGEYSPDFPIFICVSGLFSVVSTSTGLSSREKVIIRGRLTELFSRVPQIICPRFEIQPDFKTEYLADCQRVIHSLVSGWKLACLKGCGLEFLKASWLHFSLTRKPYIQLAANDLYISSSRAEHRPDLGVMNQALWKDLSKTSLQGLRGLFIRYYLCNMGCLQGNCISCQRLDIFVDK